MKSSRVVVGHSIYKFAQDPPNETGQEMVEDLRKGPAENWRKFLQPIIIHIRNKYGLDVGQVSLVGPRIETEFTSPSYGFSIVGHVRFSPEPPVEVVKDHGQPPYAFKAAVTPNGDLVSSVRIVGSEG